MGKYVLVLDEGTTGTRALLFDQQFKIAAQCYEEFTQYTPSEDRVEHDANEIWEKTLRMCCNAIQEAGASPSEIDSIGITNQRATTVIWDKTTGEPLSKAIVWQDNRTAEECRRLNESPWGEKARKATGWTVAPVYSSLMLKWLVENVAEVQAKLKTGEALAGTIDTWLVWKLTEGRTHAVSYSNASVMGSLDLSTGEWYTEFLEHLGVPLSLLPEIRNDSGDYGSTTLFGAEIPITGVIADQHAALYAQGCRTAGKAKCTNGTGSFLDVNIGENCVVSDAGVNTVIAWKIGDKITYAIEGYAPVTGSAIQWLRDGLEVIKESGETEALARSVPDSNGVVFVPALSGLSAPYHDPFARGTIIGITRGTKKAHLVRATLEAIAFSIKDIVDAIATDTGVPLKLLNIDGGASRNDLLAQMFADYLNATIERPASVEATSLGAAQMAGLATGFWKESDFETSFEIEKTFTPSIDAATRTTLYTSWCEAVKRSQKWIRQA